MYLAVFVFITAMHGPKELPDLRGPNVSLEACIEVIKKDIYPMSAYLSQFGLVQIKGVCRKDNSQAT